MIFEFDPKENITTKELAEIFSTITTGIIQLLVNQTWSKGEKLQIEIDMYDSLSDEAKKHFKKVNNE